MAGSYADLAIVAGIDTATNTPVVMTSPDAQTWTTVSSWPGAAASHVVVAGDTYIVGTAPPATNNLATSTDGAAFTLRNAPFALAGMVWTGTEFVAVQSTTAYTAAPTNLSSWTTAGSTGTSHTIRRLMLAGGVIVGTGLGGGGATQTVIYSTDSGASWSTYSSSTGTRDGQDVAYGAGRWVIPRRRTSGGDPADIGIITSTDGISWSLVNTGIALDNSWYHAHYGNGIFLLIGNTNTGAAAVATSTTGAANSFSVHTPTGLPAFPSQAGRLAFWKGRFLYVQPLDGTIYDSTDGIAWTGASFADRDWRGLSAGQARPRGRRGLGLVR